MLQCVEQISGIDQLLLTPEIIRLASWRIEVLLNLLNTRSDNNFEQPSDSSIYTSVAATLNNACECFGKETASDF